MTYKNPNDTEIFKFDSWRFTYSKNTKKLDMRILNTGEPENTSSRTKNDVKQLESRLALDGTFKG